MKMLAIALIFILLSTAYALDYTIDAPKEVNVGEWFKINVSVFSDKDLNLTAYSYVYKNFNCVGQGWVTNKKEVFLHSGESKNIILEDLIKHGTESGYYNLRVKLRYDNETIVETYNLKVNSGGEIDTTYLYIGLVVVSLVGLYLVIRKG